MGDKRIKYLKNRISALEQLLAAQEEVIIKHSEKLSGELSNRRKKDEELRKAMQAAESAGRSRSEFISNMSHEIRTPMNAIIGMTELTRDLCNKNEQRDCLENVQKNAWSLLDIISNALNLSVKDIPETSDCGNKSHRDNGY